MNPYPFYPEYVDVDCSDRIDIIDALIIGRYHVTIITEFTCNGTTLSPDSTITPSTPPPVLTPFTNTPYPVTPEPGNTPDVSPTPSGETFPPTPVPEVTAIVTIHPSPTPVSTVPNYTPSTNTPFPATSEPSTLAGDCWLETSVTTGIPRGDIVAIELHCNTGVQNLESYSFIFRYNSYIVVVDTTVG